MAFLSSGKIDITRFLDLAKHTPVVDVRSPSEYNQGHIPGAFNIPLFDDDERREVGTLYNDQGREKAILKGLELIGGKLDLKLAEALHIAKDLKLLVHCWRGGMRSETMAWLFSLGGIHSEVLEGGYKSYRHQVLSGLAEKKKGIVLGGMTGSGKTQILRFIHSTGVPIIDLEGIACHKGSAFGSLGQLPQPTSEQFANLLYDEWRCSDSPDPIWLEDESRNIGTVFIPDTFYGNMQEYPAIILKMEIKTRLPRLMEEYSGYPPDTLKAVISKIRKRLGGDNANDALKAVDENDFVKAIEITLRYYDKTYLYGITRRPSNTIITVETDTDDIRINSAKVLEAAGRISW